LTDIAHLTEWDVDEQTPHTIFSQHYSVLEFTSNNCNDHDFSIFHSNIRRLSLHCGNTANHCAQMKVFFNIIGVSETWNSTHSETFDNIRISGYSYYETESTSQDGGVGLYAKNFLPM